MSAYSLKGTSIKCTKNRHIIHHTSYDQSNEDRRLKINLSKQLHTMSEPQRGELLEYIGRYTHKISISNYRIENINDKNITYSYTDRKANRSTLQ